MHLTGRIAGIMAGVAVLFRNAEGQRQIEKVPDPLVSIRPETAANLGLAEGDWAVISTPHGAIRQRVHITDVMSPGTVDAQHSWWFPARNAKLPDLSGAFDFNANMLCPDEPEFCSLEIGSWPHMALMCRMEKE
ncbi:molybdopterin dinucleotide binding domain-containing protein [Pseudodesulfovibrio methanolicus]|uniref:Molybdopterin dinucleotide binding domain-containing protein n=1 Tax=Pseudodesulfovibrio methanolicus TaxID=3126690 RepID=A0ABZ2J4C2_9BACT